MKTKERIEVNAKVAFGKPVIAGTRMAVQFVLELLAQGWSVKEVLEEYPHLKKEDILACIEYAKDLVEERVFFSLEKTEKLATRRI